MKETYKDTDLREALRRKYSDSPQLPADFLAKMHGQMTSEPVAKTRKLWRWVAAAACLLFVIGIGFMLMPNGESSVSQPLVAQNAVQPTAEMSETKEKEVTSKEGEPQEESVSPQPADTESAADGHRVRRGRTNVGTGKKSATNEADVAANSVEGESDGMEDRPEGQEWMPDMMQADPFLMAEAHAEQIRTRGMRLQREIEQLMNN